MVEPYESGMFPVGDGHEVYYELCGNPRGKPVVFLHGGPGSGIMADHRRFFDPERYRILLFDQRGAGRSTPAASIEANTTQHLIADIEALRRHIGVERWVVFGGSWGSTLGLAYAAAHPEACVALVLRGIWLCRKADLRWWLYGVRTIFTEFWDEFAGYLPEAERGDILENYFKRMVDPDPATHMPAAAAWKTYESRIATLIPSPGSAKTQSLRTLAMSRIEAHYMRNAVFLAEGALLDAVPRFRHVPGVIVHGRYDVICPAEGAVALARAWPEAVFTIVPDAGHSAMEPGIRKALIAATDRLADLD
ncbi:MAG: prolyl aminopeptidase [Alphaproteobacteria bacterium]|nr:prolyl aminopeptidase [Alphaproteobacteria bacterium]